MNDPHHPQNPELVEHKGYQISLSQSGLDWMAIMNPPKHRPTLIMAPDREAALSKAYEWIEVQLASAEDPA